MKAKILFGGIAAFAMLSTIAAFAEEMKMKADLSAAQEVPPNQSKGKGSAVITFDTAAKNCPGP